MLSRMRAPGSIRLAARLPAGLLVGLAAGLAAAAVLAGCGHSAGSTTPTVTAAFTPAHEHLVVAPGTRVVVQMSHGEPNPPASSDPRVVAPGSAGPSASGQVVFTARRAGTATIFGQLPCAGTACTAMRGWITILVKG